MIEQKENSSHMSNSTESPLCALCGSKTQVRFNLPHIWHQSPKSKKYQIYWCKNCDFGFLYPQPTAEELSEFYGSDYFARYAGEEQAAHPNQIKYTESIISRYLERIRLSFAWRLDKGYKNNANFIHELANKSALSICDIGCGNGDLLLNLQNLGHKCVGIEIDHAARQRAQTKGLTVYPGSAENLPQEVSGRLFDIVTMTHVLEHCLSPLAAIDNVSKLLKPNGRVFVEVPNNNSYVSQRFGEAWYHCDAGRHLYFFTEKSLSNLFKKCGMEISAVGYSNYHSQYTNDRLYAEQMIWDLLFKDEKQAPMRNSNWELLKGIIRTAFAEPQVKYEVVSIIGSKNNAQQNDI